ncbi:hypothetical protein DL546_008405 [Coniochaeta pulveracea]|uniref:Uncharacterized protein n=1 Tax=Coniochaeta pulveracea TaxID=177199 RepID=A0A420YD06_9PEZI|nr:hypothetical protein DL546_008405 [Coniochaeta pulveracea]
MLIQASYHAALYTSHTVADVNLCGVSVNPSLLGTATLLNLILVMLLAWILFYAFKSSSQSLVSLGDAISSFLEHKDGYIQKSSNSNNWGVEKTAERRYCWFRIPSVPTWLLFVISWTVPTALAAAVFGRSLQSRQFTFSSFGSIDSSNYTNLNTPSTPLGTSIIAALPQLLLALLYLSTNYLLTTYYLCKEISLYSNQARSLRVTTSPQGSQTPSLYLTLPRPWSWFLVTFFTAMSFVLSQSVFSVAFDPVSIANMHSNGTGNTPRTVIGFSGTGLLILLVLLFVLFLVVIGQGFRPIEPLPGLPSIKTPTSRDISSCCHPDQGRWERREA